MEFIPLSADKTPLRKWGHGQRYSLEECRQAGASYLGIVTGDGDWTVVDIDLIDTLEGARRFIKDFPPEMVVQSSPRKFHCYYKGKGRADMLHRRLPEYGLTVDVRTNGIIRVTGAGGRALEKRILGDGIPAYQVLTYIDTQGERPRTGKGSGQTYTREQNAKGGHNKSLGDLFQRGKIRTWTAVNCGKTCMGLSNTKTADAVYAEGFSDHRIHRSTCSRIPKRITEMIEDDQHPLRYLPDACHLSGCGIRQSYERDRKLRHRQELTELDRGVAASIVSYPDRDIPEEDTREESEKPSLRERLRLISAALPLQKPQPVRRTASGLPSNEFTTGMRRSRRGNWLKKIPYVEARAVYVPAKSLGLFYIYCPFLQLTYGSVVRYVGDVDKLGDWIGQMGTELKELSKTTPAAKWNAVHARW